MKSFLCSAALTAILAAPLFAQTFTLLHTFANAPDGDAPYGGLIRDGAGNLYGTTAGGGTSGTGAVFKVGSHGEETVLYSFGPIGSGDGSVPSASLTLDDAGNLYGTTTSGGTYNSGTVFKVNPAGNETLLYSFSGLPGDDGFDPLFGSLIRDAAGNLYGTTAAGGSACIGFSNAAAPYSRSTRPVPKPCSTASPEAATERFPKTAWLRTQKAIFTARLRRAG